MNNNEIIINSKEDFLTLFQNKLLEDNYFKSIPGFTEKKFKKKIKALIKETKDSKCISMFSDDTFIPNDYSSKITNFTMTSDDNKDEVLFEMLNQIDLKLKSYRILVALYKDNYYKITELAKNDIYFLIEAPYVNSYSDVGFLGSVLLEVMEEKNTELTKIVKEIYVKNIDFTFGDGQDIKHLCDLQNNHTLFKRGNKFILDKINFPLTKINDKNLIIEINNILNENLIFHVDFMTKELNKTNLLEETKNDELLKYYDHIKKLDQTFALFDFEKAKNYVFNLLTEEYQFYLNESEPRYIIEAKKEVLDDGFVLQKIVFPHILFDNELSVLNQLKKSKEFEQNNFKNKYFTNESSYSYIKDINIDMNFKREIGFDTLGCEIVYTYKIQEEFAEVAAFKFIENFLEKNNVANFDLKFIKNNENKEILLRDIYLSKNLTEIEKVNVSRVKKKV